MIDGAGILDFVRSAGLEPPDIDALYAGPLAMLRAVAPEVERIFAEDERIWNLVKTWAIPILADFDDDAPGNLTSRMISDSPVYRALQALGTAVQDAIQGYTTAVTDVLAGD